METILLSVLGVLATACLGVLTWSATRKAGDRARITSLEDRMDAQEQKKLVAYDYVEVLRRHIIDERPPPPPPYPKEMIE